METKIILSTRQFATIKRVAMNVNPMVTKKIALYKKIDEMYSEISQLEQQISGFEAGIKCMCGGLGSEQLVHKVVSTTDKTDSKGKALTKTTYEPNDCLVYDENNNNYVLSIITPDEDIETEFEIIK